jgi:hypothetical protein
MFRRFEPEILVLVGNDGGGRERSQPAEGEEKRRGRGILSFRACVGSRKKGARSGIDEVGGD